MAIPKFARGFIRFFRAPTIGEQNTGYEAYQQYQGYAYAGINGNGGQGVRRTMKATSPAGITPGNSLVKRDPTQTGNPNWNLELLPLSEQENNLSSM